MTGQISWERLTMVLRKHWPIYDPSADNGYRGGPFDMDAVALAQAMARDYNRMLTEQERRGVEGLCTYHWRWEPVCGRPAGDRRVHSPENERKRPRTHIWRHDPKDAHRIVVSEEEAV